MRRRTITAGLAALATVATMGALVAGQEPQDVGAYVAKPTPEHERLQGEVGTWDATIKTFMAGPDAPPEVAEGVETSRMLGELWLISDFQGDMGGLPFSGHSQSGFDSKADHYVLSWIDSMSTAMMSMTGTYDPASKALTMTGKGLDPMLGREIDHKTFAMFVKAPEYGDDWVKGMEIEYTRRKDSPAK